MWFDGAAIPIIRFSGDGDSFVNCEFAVFCIRQTEEALLANYTQLLSFTVMN
jgi:hypothetical protein